MSWTRFLEEAAPAEHAVQVYVELDELDELAASVGRFLDAGFRAGEPAVVISTPATGRCSARKSSGSAGRSTSCRRTACSPAVTQRRRSRCSWTVMARPATASKPSSAASSTTSQAAFRTGRSARSARWSICSSSVDRKRRRSTWRSSGTDCSNREPARAVCVRARRLRPGRADVGIARDRPHPHAPAPVSDSARLAAAVHDTLTDVVGSDAAARIYLRVAEEVPRTALPRAQALLMWLSNHEPSIARRVLSGARARYAPAT